MTNIALYIYTVARKSLATLRHYVFVLSVVGFIQLLLLDKSVALYWLVFADIQMWFAQMPFAALPEGLPW